MKCDKVYSSALTAGVTSAEPSSCAMFQCLWLFTYGISYTAASQNGLAIPIPEKVKIDSLALELAIDDTNEDKNQDAEPTDNSNINSDNNIRRYSNGGKMEKFTDFIQLVIEVLYKYDDEDLEHFIATLNDEVGKYHYNGCKFYELTDNESFKKFIASKFDEFKNIPASTIRQKILTIADQIEEAKYKKPDKELIDFINSLYRQDVREKFNKFLTKINDYRLKTNENLDLVKIVRDGIRSLIFNHYTKLEYNTRAAFKYKLDQYWEYVMGVPSLRSHINPKEIQLLNRYDGGGSFYFTKKNIEPQSNAKANVRWHPTTISNALTFMTIYPKLMLDLQKLNLQDAAHTATTFRPKNELILHKPDRVQYQQTTNFEDNSALNSMFNQKHVPKSISRDLYLDEPISEIDNDSITDSTLIKQAHKKSKRKKVLRENMPTENEVTTEDTTLTEFTTQAYKPFIDVVTMRQYVPKRSVKFQKIKYDINLRNGKDQLGSEVIQSDEVNHKSSNEDAAITEETHSAEEHAYFKTSTRAYRRNFHNNLPADTFAVDENVLTRLKHLENELKDVRTLVKNDTEIIQDLKSNMLVGDTDGKTSKEYVLAKVIPCDQKDKEIPISPSEDVDNIPRHSYDKRKLRNNYDEQSEIPRRYLESQEHTERQKIIKRRHQSDRSDIDASYQRTSSAENVRLQHRLNRNDIENERERRYQSDYERPVIPHLDRLKYGKKNDEPDSNEEKYRKHMFASRRDMINKVDEIKKKFDGAVRNSDNYRRMGHGDNIDIDSDFIPDKDTFNKNMRSLEHYLDAKKHTRHRHDDVQD